MLPTRSLQADTTLLGSFTNLKRLDYISELILWLLTNYKCSLSDTPACQSKFVFGIGLKQDKHHRVKSNPSLINTYTALIVEGILESIYFVFFCTIIP